MANPFAFATVNHIPLALGIPYVSLAQGDLVLDMPGISGVDLLDQLRVSGIATPALFVTGRRVTEDLRLAADRLRAALFEKPMLPEELISAVREALG